MLKLSPPAEASIRWFRRALCGAWIWTLGVRLLDVRAHYTDEGLLPRELLSTMPWKLSLNMLSGSLTWQLCVFAISFVAALGCAFEKRTAACALVLWLTCISILSRNELVTNGADHYFAMLLLWNVLLAWRPTRMAAAYGYTLQIAFLYLFTGLAKAHFAPWRDGTAMADVLSLDILTRPWSQSLIAYPGLMKAMTWFTLAAELGGALALFAGLFSQRVRAGVIVVLGALHLGIIALLKLYLIPVMSLISLIPFVPPQWWPKSKSGEELPAALNPVPAFAVAALVVLFLAWNISNLPSQPFKMPEAVSRATASVRLDQDWSFYAPPPTPGFNGWWVIEGTTAEGRNVDAWQLREEPPSPEKPAKLSEFYPNQHWTAYFINLAVPSNRPFVEGLLSYLCKRWSANLNGSHLSSLHLERRYSIYAGDPQVSFSEDHACN